MLYVGGQVALYAQDRSAPMTTGEPETPWQHLSLEGALAIAVGVQYRENRQKEAAATALSRDAAAAITRATEIMSNVTRALEILTEKVEECPVRSAPAFQKRIND